jgi:hypothetical protein
MVVVFESGERVPWPIDQTELRRVFQWARIGFTNGEADGVPNAWRVARAIEIAVPAIHTLSLDWGHKAATDLTPHCRARLWYPN